MLERVWRKGDALALLVGMETDTATVGDSTEIPKKPGMEPPHDPVIPLLGVYPAGIETEKNTRIPLFAAALLTGARTGKQPRCPSTHGRIKTWTYTLRNITRP